jgi:hypothetical protein
MLNQNFYRISTGNMVRLFQIIFLVVALWFFFWAHIYEMIVWNKTFVESIQSSIPNVVLYAVSILALILLEIPMKRRRQVSTVSSPSAKTLEDLQRENELLKRELLSSKKIPSNKIGIALLIVGALLLVVSVVISSTILAFMGLGLIFWGVLFLLVRPTKFVRSTILGATAISSYVTLDRIIDDLNYKGNPIYIPPYPKDTYLPEHLAGLKEMVVFISAKESITIPSIEEMAKNQFLVKNPEGICITPPGSGLVSLFEKELRTDFTKIDQESFYEGLPRIIVNNLELATDLEIKAEKEAIYVKITDSVYNHLYSQNQNLKTIHSVGCPLTSAVSCALAIKTGKPVTITKSKISPNLKTIEIWYQLIEG